MARIQRHDESPFSQDELTSPSTTPEDEPTSPSTTLAVKDSSDNSFFLKSAAEMEDIMESAKHHSMKLEDNLEKTSYDLQSDRADHFDTMEAGHQQESDRAERSDTIES